MMTITVQLDEAKAAALREKSEGLGLNIDQLLSATIGDLIGQSCSDFDEAAKRVLAKNKELYRRLSCGTTTELIQWKKTQKNNEPRQ